MIDEAVAAVHQSQVIGLPTDTVYGLGADPFSEEAISKLFDMKGRPSNKPVGVLVASADQAGEIGLMTRATTELANMHWPGALTVIVNPKVVMADWVGDQQLRTLGIRVPDHPVALGLLRLTGPLAVTSANRSGGAETMSDREARDVFGSDVAVYLQGRAPGGQASTVIDAIGVEPTVLRQGPVRI